MIKLRLLLVGVIISTGVHAQDDFEGFEEEPKHAEPFSSTRVINGHSTETLEKKTLEFRIEHRFGDMFYVKENGMLAGDVQNWFGFDNASDIRFGFEYGITDDIMIGIGRSKGSGAPYKSLLDGFVKYRILRQQAGKMPISMAVVGSTFFTYMKKSDDISQVSAFPNWQHRLSYSAQLNVSRAFGDLVTLQLSPTLVHRNYVDADDKNTIFALGGAIRVAAGKKMGVIIEYFQAFRGEKFQWFDRNNTNIFRNSLGLAFEFKTFGHNFTVNLTNSKGFGDVQYIPYTYSDWLLGQWRLGFTIGRKFSF